MTSYEPGEPGVMVLGGHEAAPDPMAVIAQRTAAERGQSHRPRIGVDVGQAVDPTAIAVVLPRVEGGENLFGVRRLERIPLGTDYLAVGARLAELTGNVHRRTSQDVEVFMDYTGVGRPVFDILQNSIKGIPCTVYAVAFVSGDNLRAVERGAPTGLGRLPVRSQRFYSVGKGYLVSRLKALLQTRRVRGALTPEWQALEAELGNYEIHAREGGRDQFGAFKTGTHDDLVTALALAVLIEPPQGGAMTTELVRLNRTLAASSGTIRRKEL